MESLSKFNVKVLNEDEVLNIQGGAWWRAIPIVGGVLTGIVAIGTVIDEVARGFNQAAEKDCDGIFDDENKCL